MIYSKRSIILLLMGISILYQCTGEKLIKKTYQLHYPNDLHVILQTEWGGTKPKFYLKNQTIDRITLHHGGVEFKDDKDPIEYLKNLQSWSRSEKKWMDIPYHFLIDLKGNIYEGRSLEYPGDTNTNYNPTGHLLICLLGNYEEQKVNESQLRSIIRLSTYFCRELGINPDLIKSHKDYTETACPGKDFYRYIQDGTIINKVKENLKSNKMFWEDS